MTHSCRNSLCDTPHYEDDELPDILQMECPIGGHIDCLFQMDRNEMGVHLGLLHRDYEDDPEPFFDAERERRFRCYGS